MSFPYPAGTYANVCAGQPDGTVVEPACRTYSVCQNQVPVSVECAEDQAYDSAKQSCQDINTVPAPCGYYRDCSGKEDRRYVDVNNFGCDAYYTCHNGYFYGFNFCPSGEHNTISLNISLKPNYSQ